jgi:5-deoxy-glucuronate isomerase
VPDPEIHAAALPNLLSAEQLRLRANDRGEVAVDPTRAGWRYLTFRAAVLGDEPLTLAPDQEHAVVVVSGGDVELTNSDESVGTIEGRPSPFLALPSAAYVPVGHNAGIAGSGSLVAIASAPPSGREGVATEPFVIGRSDIRVELRGAGNATRQINHIIAPGSAADRLEVVEVLTPSGNWSSWPPHKHDVDDMPTEAVLEEIYYYRFRTREAWGMQRLYRGDRSRDCAWEVHAGDVVLVTDGYHPFVAAHGNDAYYLNALAGDRRTMACSYDPDLDWVRSTWDDMTVDPRVPLVRQ